jgi:hypothetical protein
MGLHAGVAADRRLKRPVYTIQLRPEPSCANPILALRGLLKVALRAYRLRCVSVTEANGRPAWVDDDISKSVAEGLRVIRERVRSGGKGWPPDGSQQQET